MSASCNPGDTAVSVQSEHTNATADEYAEIPITEADGNVVGWAVRSWTPNNTSGFVNWTVYVICLDVP